MYYYCVSHTRSRRLLGGGWLPHPFLSDNHQQAPGLFETPLLEGLPPAVKDALGKTVPCPNRLGRPDEFGDLVGAILTINSLNGCVLRLDGALRMPP